MSDQNPITGDRPGKARLVKVVRDRVDVHIPEGSTVVVAAIPDRRTAIERLRAKLVEEAVEYLTDPSASELADVLETVRALAYHDVALRPSPEECMEAIEWHADRKREDRGGFDALTGMYVVGPGETL